MTNVVDGKETIKFLPPNLLARNKSLQEQTFMIRRSYIEVLDYFRQMDWNNHVKFVLWGPFGTGKSTTLTQLTHFALNSKYLVLNFRDLKNILAHNREAVESEFKSGRWNFPQEAQLFLREIKHYNQDKFEGLVTHKSYKWSEM